MSTTTEKKARLEALLREAGSAAIAFSAGVDSTFLLQTAHDVLGDGAVAVTVRSAFVPAEEVLQSQAFCASRGIRQIVQDVDVTAIDGVMQNPPDRCYRCKRVLFTRITQIARENGLRCVMEGSNADDLGDYRPGMRAIRELGVRSPLLDAKLTKAEIRALSREAGLPTWDKPAMACLATRFPTGERIATDKLSAVEHAEALLHEMGFHQLRVRVHGDLARLELEPCETSRAFAEAQSIRQALHALGFRYVALDLDGYKTGNMNAK